MIPESKNDKSLLAQPIIPLPIIVMLIGMLSAVDLDNNSLLQTDKVDDVDSDWLLPAKLETVELPHSDATPEQLFSFGGVVAKRPGV